VHELIARNGFDKFYDLSDGNLQPAKSLVFQKRDYTWLRALVTAAEASEIAALRLDVQGMSCIACAWLIEQLFSRKPGALEIRVNPALGTLEARWQTGVFDIVAFAQELQSFGYLLGPPGRERKADRPLLLRMGICGALAMNTMLFTLPGYLGMHPDAQFSSLFQRCSAVLGTLSIVVGGSYFFQRCWQSLRKGILHIDLPISLGLIAAYAGSLHAFYKGASGAAYFDFVSVFTFLMLVGRWLQQNAIERNRTRLLALQGDPPPVTDAVTGEKIPVSQIAPQMTLLVNPGQLVPVNSQLNSLAASLGMEWINGESEPAVAARGRILPAGAANCGQAAIEIRTLQGWPDSLLAKLSRLSPNTTERNATVERFIRYYIAGVLLIALSGFATWWLLAGDLARALQVAMAVLVVSCPCASGVALPLCTNLAVSRLRQKGLYVRDPGLWHKLDRLRRIVFDKTGTLTPESITLQNPEALDNLTGDHREALLALVRDSLHPTSSCLREQLLAAGVELKIAGEVTETIGFGLESKSNGAKWRLGRPEWAANLESTHKPGITATASGDCAFSCNSHVLARFSFAEEARADAADELRELQRRNCEIYILSGDRETKVAAMANRLGLNRDHYLAELSPEQKADWVAQHDHNDTLYIGDGANDSLAFDAASCTGTPAVDRGLLEKKASFYFLGRGIGGVRALLEMASTRRRTVQLVLLFTITYNLAAIAVSLAGHMNPLLAAIVMPASSLVSLLIVFAGLNRR